MGLTPDQSALEGDLQAVLQFFAVRLAVIGPLERAQLGLRVQVGHPPHHIPQHLGQILGVRLRKGTIGVLIGPHKYIAKCIRGIEGHPRKISRKDRPPQPMVCDLDNQPAQIYGERTRTP